MDDQEKFIDRKVLMIISIVIIGLTFSVIFIFIYFFYNQEISDKISDWGAFGDYVSGTLNTFLSFLTLTTTIYIAYQLHKFDENRDIRNNQFENRKLMREIREQEYRNISGQLNSIWTILINRDIEIGRFGLFVLYNRYTDFLKYKKHLFPNLHETEFTDLQKFINDCHTYYVQNEEINFDKIPNVKNLSETMDKFHTKLQEFLLHE